MLFLKLNVKIKTGGWKHLKLFGGNGGRRDADDSWNEPETQYAETRFAPKTRKEKQETVSFRTKPAMTAAKPEGKKTTSKKKKNNGGRTAWIVAGIIMLALVCSVGAAAWIWVKPPETKNDPTIKDTENGDKVNMDNNTLLNQGTRVDDVFTFVVGAVDEDETRTDALMVARMDTKQKTINVMNIPRDTMCNNGEGESWRKINAAYGMKKGIEQTKIEIERIMGFQPDKYVILNFDGIEAIVDAIGGIEYEVPFRMEYSDPSQDLHIDLYAGSQTLTGKQTVEFLRWRHNDDYTVQYENGDEGRVENQQKFLKSVAKQVLQFQNVTKIKSITEAVFNNVKTDFTAGELLWMGMQALQIENDNIQFFTLPGYGQMSTAGSSLALSFFFPYETETLDLVNKYFNPFEEPITELDIVSGPEGGYETISPDSDPEDNYVWGDTSELNESQPDEYLGDSDSSYSDEYSDSNGDYSSDGSSDYSSDGSGDYSSDGSGDYSDDGSGDYSDDGSGDYSDDGSGDYSDDGSSDYPGDDYSEDDYTPGYIEEDYSEDDSGEVYQDGGENYGDPEG